jgi:pyridinium-3,5-biscarboxylic acid mononucleotide sulfurtransferase
LKSMASLDFSESQIVNSDLLAKYRQLRKILGSFKNALVGFSGGADSTLLTGVARDVLGRDSVTAYLALGPSLPRREQQEAIELCVLLDVRLVQYPATEFENPAYVANGPDRCFHCKADLFAHLKHFAQSLPEATLLYGGNVDDTHDFRPGRLAAQEYGAQAPLAEADLSKAEVRALSNIFHLPTADKPAQPCLSSRIPYGRQVDKTKLAMVEAGEIYLAEMGFREFRLRHFGTLARLEVPVDQFTLWEDSTKKTELFQKLIHLGFKQVEIDALGFRSGSLNEVLSKRQKEI